MRKETERESELCLLSYFLVTIEDFNAIQLSLSFGERTKMELDSMERLEKVKEKEKEKKEKMEKENRKNSS